MRGRASPPGDARPYGGPPRLEPYGTLSPGKHAGNEQGITLLTELFGYTGERQDGWTGHSDQAGQTGQIGVVYLRARWLHPHYGRFLSPDPYAGALDRPLSQQDYAYAEGNPTSRTDRTGLYAALLDETRDVAFAQMLRFGGWSPTPVSRARAARLLATSSPPAPVAQRLQPSLHGRETLEAALQRGGGATVAGATALPGGEGCAFLSGGYCLRNLLGGMSFSLPLPCMHFFGNPVGPCPAGPGDTRGGLPDFPPAPGPVSPPGQYPPCSDPEIPDELEALNPACGARGGTTGYPPLDERDHTIRDWPECSVPGMPDDLKPEHCRGTPKPPEGEGGGCVTMADGRVVGPSGCPGAVESGAYAAAQGGTGAGAGHGEQPPEQLPLPGLELPRQPQASAVEEPQEVAPLSALPEAQAPEQPVQLHLPRLMEPEKRAELEAEAQRVKQAHNVGGGRNVAVAEYELDGQRGTLPGVSGRADRPGTAPVPLERRFEWQVIDFARDLDAELKILEDLAARLTPDSTGTVYLYSERRICGSCDGVIVQFRVTFPGVLVVAEHGDR